MGRCKQDIVAELLACCVQFLVNKGTSFLVIVKGHEKGGCVWNENR